MVLQNLRRSDYVHPWQADSLLLPIDSPEIHGMVMRFLTIPRIFFRHYSPAVSYLLKTIMPPIDRLRTSKKNCRCGNTLLFFSLLTMLLLSGCAKPPVAKIMETTAYCGCSSCCGWERGSWRLLKLDFWNRYVSSGPSAGTTYSGLTASGTTPENPRRGCSPWIPSTDPI